MCLGVLWDLLGLPCEDRWGQFVVSERCLDGACVLGSAERFLRVPRSRDTLHVILEPPRRLILRFRLRAEHTLCHHAKVRQIAVHLQAATAGAE